MINRTKRLTINRALELLQLEYGTQVREVKKIKKNYIVDRINGNLMLFTRDEILNIENEIFGMFGIK